ncbi:SgcJ/EcaC family oxidoreductase [Agromyces sp. NPDC058484]|uniref:SgcJ/EcaC family oxidoreductase n=1 Tax=Agromyces sp. NPDC058484 TaxID=3346524 RepID=UPI003656F3A0
MDAEVAARTLYQRLLDGWNARDAEAMTSVLAADALVVGFDGSQMDGREAATSELDRIFADHEPARYVARIRWVRSQGDDSALLYAVAGMVAPGSSEIMPDRNAVQTVIARAGDSWTVALFQTTPAVFDGRPELSEALTAELNELVPLQPWPAH